MFLPDVAYYRMVFGESQLEIFRKVRNRLAVVLKLLIVSEATIFKYEIPSGPTCLFLMKCFFNVQQYSSSLPEYC